MLNPSSKLRDRIREATADAILAAAESVFAESGVHQAKVDEIATRAGVSVGTLYNYFPDRDGLLSALIETRRSNIREKMDELVANAGDRPFAELLSEFFRAGFEHFDAHRDFFTIIFQCELDRKQLPGKEGPRETMRNFYMRAKALTDRGVQRGELRADLADLFPGILMGMWKAAILAHVYEGATGPMVDRSRDLVEFFMHGAGIHHG
jgi:AcrR family transcriptional regulator